MREHEHLQGVERPALSLADLEAIDSGSRGQGTERRFCCPLPACEGKPRDRSHRSLSLQVATGLWHCFRCGASGLLHDRATGPGWRSDGHSVALKAGTEKQQVTRPDNASRWLGKFKDASPIAATPGEAYLKDRGIPRDIATEAGVRYAPSYFGRPAVLFPVRTTESELIAVHGRYIDQAQPRMRTSGPKRRGIFSTGERIDHGLLAVTEAPIDALSLAVLGLPALAICGTSWPRWLPAALAGKSVYLAFDADEAGDAAAAQLRLQLTEGSVQCQRLRPPGVKDWNDALLAGFRTRL